MSRIIWVSCIVFSMLALGLMSGGWTVAASESAAAACTNLLQNSTMESNGGWLFGQTAAQGDYTTEQALSPVRSARLGIVNGGNIASFSSMRQFVTAPNGDQVRLRAFVYPISESNSQGDVQEIQIMDEYRNILRTVRSGVSNAQSWQEVNTDLSEFAGQSIMLYINVYNDGVGGRTAMYVDDVVMEVCSNSGGPTNTPAVVTMTPTSPILTATPTLTPNIVTATPTQIVVTNTPTQTPTSSVITATPTPVVVTNTPSPTPTSNVVTATPTPIVVTNTPTPTTSGPIVVTNTPTPTPTGVASPLPPAATYTPVPPGPDSCQESLVNSGFEFEGGWRFGETVLKPGYSGERAYTGARSGLMGNPNYDRPNYDSYSSIRQTVFMPRGAYATAWLEFWHYTISNQEPDDYQEVIILDAPTGRTLEILWRVNRNDQLWQQERFDLTRFLGQNIVLYFNVRNQGGGGRASMYIDDVSLRLCSGYSSGGGASTGGQQPFPQVTPTIQPYTPHSPTSDTVVAPPIVITVTSVPTDTNEITIPVITGTPSPAPPTATPTIAITPTAVPLTTILPIGEGRNPVPANDSAFSFMRLFLQCILALALLFVILFVLFFLYRFIRALLGRRQQP